MKGEYLQMATIKYLEELGKKFIEAEIYILNETNTSVFENGIYNDQFENMDGWKEGIEEFLKFNMNNENIRKVKVRYLYQNIFKLVNDLYLSYKQTLNDVDRLNLKLYLQIDEILNQEEKIINLEKHKNDLELTTKKDELQEKLNDYHLTFFEKELNTLDFIIDTERIEKAIKIIFDYEKKKETKKYTENEITSLEKLYELTQNKDVLIEERETIKKNIDDVKKTKEIIEENKKNYEKIKKELEVLKKDQNAVNNFFNNQNAVSSAITLIEKCCNSYYFLLSIDEFISCLNVIGIEGKFQFLKPLELMSYSKLRSGLLELGNLLIKKDIKNQEFYNMIDKYLYLKLIRNKEPKLFGNFKEYIEKGLSLNVHDNFIRFFTEKQNDFIKALNEVKG